MSTSGLWLTVAALALVSTGCDHMDREPEGPLEHSNRTIEMDKSEAVRVVLKQGVGRLHVFGGSTNLMEASFTYTGSGNQPKVHYDAAGFRSHIDIDQPTQRGVSHHHRDDEWDIRLNDEKPLSLEIGFGVGQGQLDLGQLTLQTVNLNMGVGKVELNLRGTPLKDYSVHVSGGVGETTVLLPQNVGIEARSSGGLIHLDAPSLRKRGSIYVNDAFDNGAKVTVRLDFSNGVGSIHLNP